MNASTYEQQFQDILSGSSNKHPYDNERYVHYTKLNQARINRWTKKGKILDDLAQTIQGIREAQTWVLITEPWCGDAGHSYAFIKKLAELNPIIDFQIQNRDAAGSEIDNYLTNGSKSIPILIVRDAANNDLFVWGPRPLEAQEMVMKPKEDSTLSFDEKNKQLQQWYNKDKGQTIQYELNNLLLSHTSIIVRCVSQAKR